MELRVILNKLLLLKMQSHQVSERERERERERGGERGNNVFAECFLPITHIKFHILNN